MDETTAVAMVAAGAAVVSGIISWLNRRDARNANLEGQMREGFAKAEAEREKLRLQMEDGFAKAERHREKQKDELLADRREWSSVHEVRIQNLEKTAMGATAKAAMGPSPSSSDDSSPSTRSRPPTARRQRAGARPSRRTAATAAERR